MNGGEKLRIYHRLFLDFNLSVVPLIQTQFGPIQGRQDYDPNNRLDSEFYGGIPYAQAPTGLDRSVIIVTLPGSSSHI